MLEDDITFKNYMTEYINYIKNYKLKSEYKYQKKIISGYEEYFNDNKKYLNKKYLNKKYLQGGNLKNINNINNMFQEYINIGVNTEILKEKYTKFKNYIDNIADKIKNLDTKNLNIDKIKKLNLEKVVASFDSENNKIDEINKELVYFQKKELNFDKIDGENGIEKIIDKLNKINTNVNTKQIDKDESDKVKTQIDNYKKAVLTNITKINIEIAELTQELKDFDTYLKFNFVESDIIFVSDENPAIINPSKLLSKTISNGFLNIDNNFDTIKLSINEIDEMAKNNISTPQPTQKGGEKISIDKTAEIIDLLNDLRKHIGILTSKTKKYKELLDTVNANNKYKTGYLLFMVALAVDKIKKTSTYVIYEYIGRNMINYYLKIVKDIINNEEKNSKPIIVANFNYTRDYIVLHKLEHFLIQMQKEIVSREQKATTEKIKKINFFVHISECKNNTQNMFILLNNYKIILEEYKISALNKVSIYARINDISKQPINDAKKKFFMSSYDKFALLPKAGETANPYEMFIYADACGHKTCKKCEKYEFTEVFDSTIYSNNNDLAQYMSLNTLLSNKSESSNSSNSLNKKENGIVLMTYGYSGIGKTYTLFGDGIHTDGILQSTLKTINGLKSVKFRLYEVYGFGLSYPHFWKGKKTKDYPHDIIHYKLIKENDKLKFNNIEIKSGSEFETFVQDYSDKNTAETYISIGGAEISKYFGNFSSLIESVEKFRENDISDELKEAAKKIPQHKKRRIRDTNNNDVSSRSILIYDFIIQMTNGTFVPLLIIDLPGREEIVQTFIDPYFADNSPMKELYKLGHAELKKNLPVEINFERTKMLFLMMSLNPMGIALYCYDDILEYFEEPKEKDINDFFGAINKEEANKIKNNILMKKLPIKYDLNPVEFNIDKNKNKNKGQQSEIANKFQYEAYNNKFTDNTKIIGVLGQETGFTFAEEIINYKGGQINAIIDIIDDKQNCYINIVEKKTTRGANIELKGYSTMEQKRALVCAHLINRLLMMDKFDIMYKIYEIITEKYLNKFLLAGLKIKLSQQNITITDYCKYLINSNFKSVYLQKNLDLIEKEKEKSSNDEKHNKKKTLLEKIVKNDYYLSPYEGLYINENIAGIIKYLSTHSALIPDEEKRKKQEEKLKETSRQDDNLDFQKQQKNLRLWLYDNIDVVKANAIRKRENTTDENKKKEYKLIEDYPYADIGYFFYMKDKINNNDNNNENEKSWFEKKPIENSDKITSKINAKLNAIIPKALFKSENYSNIKTEYEKVANSYESDKIFNFDNPVIKQVIEPYIKDISDYKILYLFGNYSDDNTRNMKCQNQYNLLEKTKDFIDNIVGKL